LSAEGADLTLVDHPLVPAKLDNLAELGRHRFVEHDAFLQELRRRREPLEAIFHLGACSSTTETDADYLRRNNVEYTQALWNWCAAHDTPLVYASSAATYGDGSLGFDDATPPEQLRPLNLYGHSKNEFDRRALAEIAAGKPVPPAWAGLKFFNVYGPQEEHKAGMSSVVLTAYRQILATGRVRLFRSTDPTIADGDQRRDFVFVGDCVDHMLWLWRNPQASGLYNSGTGTARTFNDLAKAVFAALGREPQIAYVDMPAGLAKQYQNYTQADMTRLRAAGFGNPATSLEDGAARYVARLSSGRRRRSA
jgi:ADP-L-glycero-D-manno-heptose 6-epimerase